MSKIKIRYVMSDIHGCYDEMIQMIDRINQDVKQRGLGPDEFQVLFLGDYVDRGPDSFKVIDFLIQRKALRPQDVFLRGNHDDWFLEFIETNGQGAHGFLSYGGIQTLLSYGKYMSEILGRSENDEIVIPREHIDFLRNLSYFYDGDPLRFYVHAGVRPGFPLTENTNSDYTWIRDDFLKHPLVFDKYVVHGHTPTRGELDIRHNRCCIDTGGVFGQKFTVAVFNDTEFKPIDQFVIAPSR